jgi:hypothetical protein
MDVLLVNNIKKYKKYIAQFKQFTKNILVNNNHNRKQYGIIKKSDQMSSNIILGGAFPDKMSEILKIPPTIKDTSKRVSDIYDTFTKFEEQLDGYIAKINEVHSLANIPELSDISTINKKLADMQKTINNIINAHSLIKDNLLPQQEIIQITKQDGYDIVSTMYYGMIENHNKLIKEISSSRENQNMEYIYNALNKSMKRKY